MYIYKYVYIHTHIYALQYIIDFQLRENLLKLCLRQ